MNHEPWPTGLQAQKLNEKFMVKELTKLGYKVEKLSVDRLLAVAQSTSAYRDYVEATEEVREDQIALSEAATIALTEAATRLRRKEATLHKYRDRYIATPEYIALNARQGEK